MTVIVFVSALVWMDLQGDSSAAGMQTPVIVKVSPVIEAAMPQSSEMENEVWAVEGTSSEVLSVGAESDAPVRVVRVVVLGKDHDVSTNATTVRQVLAAMGISPDRNDRVTPLPSTSLQRTQTVRVVDVSFERTQVRRSVAPEVQTVATEDLAPGRTRITREGRPGVLLATFQSTARDGRVAENRRLVHQTWLKEPVPTIKEVGVEPSPSPEPSSDGSESGNGGGGGGGGGSQSGTATWYRRNGMVAAHPTLPMGTKVLVTNTATGKSVTVTIDDRGPYSGAIIDLSDDAFDAIAELSTGVINVKLSW